MDEKCLHKRVDRGTVYESCLDCGAVRPISTGGIDEPWHVCDLCRFPQEKL